MPYFSSSFLRAACAFFAFCFTATAAHAIKPSGGFRESAGMQFVNIPAGSFVMGSCTARDDKLPASIKSPCAHPETEGTPHEMPQHRVRLNAFQMGKTEVTLAQFKRFIQATHNTTLTDHEFNRYNAYGDDAPVVQISWNEVQTYIHWLNATGSGYHYRLPSEAEWEYACRAGGKARYCGGTTIGAIAWHSGNSDLHPHAVAGKRANAWGLHDMSGNVWEMVADCWHDSYVGAPVDGSAWISNCDGEGHLLRGGSLADAAVFARATLRFNHSEPDARTNDNGFRLVRTR